MTELEKTYVVQFYSHDDKHELEIELECLAKALAPYLNRTQLSPEAEKKEWFPKCGCDCIKCYECKRTYEPPAAPEQTEKCCTDCGRGCDCDCDLHKYNDPPDQTEKCECDNDGARYCHVHKTDKWPSPDQAVDIVDKVMDAVYELPLGTTLNEAKSFLKARLKEALARRKA